MKKGESSDEKKDRQHYLPTGNNSDTDCVGDRPRKFTLKPISDCKIFW